MTAQFKNYLLQSGISKITVKNYLSDINHFIRWLALELNSAFSPDLVTAETIEYYKKSNKTLSASSLKRHLSSLRKFFKFLVLEGIISQSPFELITNNSSLITADPYRLKAFKDFLYIYNSSSLTIKNLSLIHI